MTPFRLLARATAIAGLLIAPFGAAPALAAPADVELLQSYIGSWKGRGTLVGAEKETVVCTLKLAQGNQDKVNYTGRCALAGTQLAVNGTLAYVDAAKRFEAAMTSNARFNGIAVGKRQGQGLVFNLKERNTDEEGNDLTVTATISLLPESIGVEFNVVFNETGDSLQANVPFSR